MRPRTLALALVGGLAATAGLLAQSAGGGYLTPPPAIVEILDAEPLPTVVTGPARETLAIISRRSMPPE